MYPLGATNMRGVLILPVKFDTVFLGKHVADVHSTQLS